MVVVGRNDWLVGLTGFSNKKMIELLLGLQNVVTNTGGRINVIFK